MRDECGDIFASLAQGWQNHGDNIQPVVEVLAEVTFFGGLGEITVGRGDHAYIDAAGPAGIPDSVKLPALQDAQEFGLESRRNLSDLIQEDGSPVGDFEESAAIVGGAGECALGVTEEFAFEQGVGKCCAVHRDERGIAPVGVLMEQVGDDFLAGSRLAGNQDGG